VGGGGRLVGRHLHPAWITAHFVTCRWKVKQGWLLKAFRQAQHCGARDAWPNACRLHQGNLLQGGAAGSGARGCTCCCVSTPDTPSLLCLLAPLPAAGCCCRHQPASLQLGMTFHLEAGAVQVVLCYC
jgi:hypothetical protein